MEDEGFVVSFVGYSHGEFDVYHMEGGALSPPQTMQPFKKDV